MQRRDFLSASSAAFAAGLLAAPALPPLRTPAPLQLKGRIRHSVCRWCYGGIELDRLCQAVAAMGIASVEILDEPEWAVARRHGLTCAVANGPGSIPDGWNRPEHHDALVARSEELLPKVAAAGLPAMIVFSGNRAGLSDEDGRRHCIAGLRRIAPLAEKLGVNVLLELLNSKVDHPDYQFDRMAFGVDVIQGVGSPRVQILYDIYHAQIMEGDVIRTLREHHALIGH
jgi:hydroxypyruvate isomerase